MRALLRDTPPDELAGYVLAVILIIGIGAFYLGPIVNWIFGPATVIASVALTRAINRRRRRGSNR
jgi:hypothetical protein